MKNLLQTHSVSWAESVKIALLAQGIEAVLLDEQSIGFLGFAGRVRVAIVRDGDFAKAERVLQDIEPPRSDPLPSWKWQKRGLICLGAGTALVFVAGATADLSRPYFPTRLLYAASMLLLVGGLLLIALGPKADHQRGDKSEGVT